MSPARTLRLGSRASLLALIQSRLVADALRAAHPELRVEIITLETRGDADSATPLTEINDPDFFSAELDQALLDGTVDLCVHSYKDLPVQRPVGIARAAIPPRANPADVVLFRPGIEAQLKSGKPLRIGSCSARRRRNVEDFLRLALPRNGKLPRFEFKALRGTVPERIDQIAASAGELDAVIVALAGIERLWNDPAGRRRIEPALEAAKLMVLPLSACPTAPGQGALAVECRADDTATAQLLGAIHDVETEQLLAIETQLVDEITTTYAATPAAVGATALPHPTLGYVARARWRAAESSAPVEITRQANQPTRPGKAQPWTAPPVRRPAEALPAKIPSAGNVFAAHWRAFEMLRPDPALRIWTSGVMSWRKLAERGIWVEGCTDHLGFEQMHDWVATASLRLPALTNWTAVTHTDAVASWADSGAGRVVATYRLSSPPESAESPAPELAQAVGNSTHLFWRTPQQFRQLGHLATRDAHHACGPGKTLAALRAAGVQNIAAFPSYKEWQQWLA